MRRVDVVLLPAMLLPRHLAERAVVVFDVLRATTTMAAALDAGVAEIRIFPDTASALAAGSAFAGSRLLCGEERCLMPAGFDLGNSPRAWAPALPAGKTVFMSTTNGTRALLAANGAAVRFPGALVNRSAVARATADHDVTLLCAGTGGEVAMEDVLGAGAVLDALLRLGEVSLESDTARIAYRLFMAAKDDLRTALRESLGGRNVIDAGLAEDIDYAARLDVLDVVGEAVGEPPVIRPLSKRP